MADEKFIIKSLEQCVDYWEVFQIERFGKILVPDYVPVFTPNDLDDLRMPDYFELELLQKGEE